MVSNSSKLSPRINSQESTSFPLWPKTSEMGRSNQSLAAAFRTRIISPFPLQTSKKRIPNTRRKSNIHRPKFTKIQGRPINKIEQVFRGDFS